MRLYLDLNCFNRPFDDQSQQRIALETVAVFTILQRIVDGQDELVWSWALEFENSRHPMVSRRLEIGKWSGMASQTIEMSDQVSQRAIDLSSKGFKTLDAFHLACAEALGCDRLLTCDDRFQSAARRTLSSRLVQNPVEYLADTANE